MNKIVFLLFVAACGSEPVNFCGEQNYRGFCFALNNQDVLEEHLIQGISITEDNIRRINPTFNIEDMMTLGQRLVTIEPNDYPHRGYTDGSITHIRVARLTSGPRTHCMEHTYLLTHELLHTYAKEVLGTSAKDNAAHDVPNVFMQWANLHDTRYKDTVEYYTYLCAAQ